VRVLGVDPGLTRCGLGVVDGGTGRTVTCVAVDVVRTPADAELATRLLLLADEVDRWLDRYQPEVVAIERVFSQHNVRTAMATAQAGGIVALAAARRGLTVMFHTPSEVKAAVTGSGRADKAQVTTMVTRLLKLAERPGTADAADALALAICHLWRAPMRNRLAEAEARAKELAKNHKARLAEATKAASKQAKAAAAARSAAATQPKVTAQPRTAHTRAAAVSNSTVPAATTSNKTTNTTTTTKTTTNAGGTGR
jgi:crossover junction endodeoxyribonuclease RuvC